MNKQIGIKVLWLDQYARLKEENNKLKQNLDDVLEYCNALLEEKNDYTFSTRKRTLHHPYTKGILLNNLIYYKQ